MTNKVFPKLCEDSVCTGCSACVNACANGALTIGTNSEGFYRPILDRDKCNSCLLCQKSCPLISRVEMNDGGTTSVKVWAAWHKDTSIREASSSGGAFSALASQVIRSGGIVVGAAYDENLSVHHIIIDNEKQLSTLRQSKYVQSNIGSCMKIVRKLLNKGRLVMFVGTPCQCGGLNRYLGRHFDNLILVDFVCHGVPSPMMLKYWKNWLEVKMGKIKNIEFRNKSKGWYDAVRVVHLHNGVKKILRGKNDVYWNGFNNNYNLQWCCYDCQFLGFPRQTDITIADFWGIGHDISFGHQKEIEDGVSLVIANNNKAVTYIEKCQDLVIHERTLEEALRRNHAALHSSLKPKSRDMFYADLQKLSFDVFINTYLKPNPKTRLVKIWREFFPAWLIKKVRTIKQK